MSIALVLGAYGAALLALAVGLLMDNPNSIWLAIATGLLVPLLLVLKGLIKAFVSPPEEEARTTVPRISPTTPFKPN